jgi:hypothetical protein
MTMSEFCDRTHLTGAQVYTLRAAGLIRPDLPASQVEFARLIKALQKKGAKLSQLARANLADQPPVHVQQTLSPSMTVSSGMYRSGLAI